MCIFIIFFCALVAQTSAGKNRDTSLDDLSKYDNSVYRGNIGVVFDHVGTVTPTASWWYHSFVVSLPIDDMTSIIRKTFDPSTEFVKVIADQLRSRVDSIRRQAIDTIPALDTTSKRGRQIRNAPLGFIGDLSRSLFGTATQEDVQKIADKVNRMISYGQGLQSDLIAHEKHFESYMSLSNRKMSNMEMYINRTVQGIASIQQNIHAFENMSELRLHALEQFSEGMFKLLTRAQDMNVYLSELQAGLSSIAAGIMPYQLIKPADISGAIDKLGDILKKAGAPLRIMQRDPAFYYGAATFLANIVDGRDIWLTLKVPVGMRENMDLYKVNVFGVPFENHTLLIKDLPAYFMADASTASRSEEVVFQAIEAEDLIQCTGKHHLVCDLLLDAHPVSMSRACVAAVWMDNQQSVETNCRTVIVPQSRQPIARPLSNGRVLLVDVKEFTKTCHDQATTTERGCTFCMITLPCNCKISTPFATDIISPSRRTCQSDKVTTHTTKIHLTNLHLLKSRMDDTLKLNIHFPSSVYQQDVIASAEYNFDNITREYLNSQSTVEVDLSNLQEQAHQLRTKTEKDRLLREEVDQLNFVDLQGNVTSGVSGIGLIVVTVVVLLLVRLKRQITRVEHNAKYAVALAMMKADAGALAKMNPDACVLEDNLDWFDDNGEVYV